MNDLRPVHIETGDKIDPGSRSKITAGVIVALVVLALGGYGYSRGMFQSAPVPDNRLPQASIPHTAPNG